MVGLDAEVKGGRGGNRCGPFAVLSRPERWRLIVNIGIADLGISRAETLEMSPVQMAELRERIELQDRPRGKVLEILFARLTAIVWNTSFGMGPENQKETKDFLLTKQAGAKPPERKPRMTKKYRRETAANWKMGFETMLRNQKLKQHKN